jgi:RND family efflux transporter MFP subunit
VEIQKARVALQNAQAQQQAAVAHEASGAADVQVLKRQLSFYTLRAPIAGWLGTIQVVPGQTIAVGTPVAEVLDLTEIDLFCLVPPSRVGRLALKQPAQIVGTDTNTQEQSPGAEGTVVYIAVQADPETGSFPVKVRFANPDLRLRGNALARVRIRTAPPQERLVLPTDALLTDQDPPQVVVVGDIKEEEGEKVGKVRLLQAVLGVRNRQRGLVEILGLEDPDHKAPVPPVATASFVVSGGHGLEDEDVVKIEETPEKKPEAQNPK